MKIRNGFVSNSSSSSFCIAKCYMTQEQVEEFRRILHEKPGEEDGAWYETYIEETELYFMGEKSMHASGPTSWLVDNGLGDKYGVSY